MKRLCIFSYYDRDGIVDEYIYFLLQQLRRIAFDLIFVANGKIIEQERLRIEKIVNVIFSRVNTGFDAGAYKYVLDRIGENYVRNYDELILCNDTFYGPFIPFEIIFERMESKECDFWGLNFTENKITDFLQSYFLVFRSRLIKAQDLYVFFHEYIKEDETDKTFVHAVFEAGLTNWLSQKGYMFGYYTSPNYVDQYRSGNMAIRDHGLPIMKKRCFSPIYYQENNVMDALSYIFNYTDYDIRIILKSVERIYGLKINESEFQHTGSYEGIPYYRPISSKTSADIISFFQENEIIYIYGAGNMAKRIWFVYRIYLKNLKGFIISPDQINNIAGCKIGKYQILTANEIVDKNKCAVLVAVYPEIEKQILCWLTGFEKVFYLW